MNDQQQTTPDGAKTYDAAVEAFAAVLSDRAVTEAIAPTMPCWRATGIIELLEQTGRAEAAASWAELHAWSSVNDEYDPHRTEDS
ncbi:hypothetical protein SAMN06295924_12310 [Rathayibacter rathayi NCPPB 2980 = VKM Ac-1601]|uniref:Uncharacterized protein n=1 Tax=Rathayibacter rathayi TaxID=33887 RepID=A0ABX5A9V9_RATRA|nr:hypothetical protein [Rathayibacter rathayi]MWV76042.1 hypothetical protein [Rathayibacter rathayi NCPPB 2980 = VKM Ac-1601]PPG65148.1 hypothetical protein C5C16_13600 [Rathayibacter rathayi]PPG74211.1 hypothetical protein C5C15_15275 [Rathayibacter rathayi]PPG87538.1 hypothetical protein C5C47_10185 [Rathayibacter rathayi]PPG95110.1 hypothetical protein C5C00_10855 [Rathayibacter rathayi]